MAKSNDNSSKAVAAELGKLLADTYTLAFKTHGYHWNVVGNKFYSLHTLFEDQYKELYLAADEIAERIRALGEPSPSSYAEFQKLATVKAEGDRPEQFKMVENLRDAHLLAAKTAYKVAELADENEDISTADLATERVTIHEKAAWMLGALLQ